MSWPETPVRRIIRPQDFYQRFGESIHGPRKAQAGEVNKSAEIRELIRQNPQITVSEAIDALAKRGIEIDRKPVYYFNKGKLSGKREPCVRKPSGWSRTFPRPWRLPTDPPKPAMLSTTILKVKHLATEVGGLKKLKSLVEALGE